MQMQQLGSENDKHRLQICMNMISCKRNYWVCIFVSRRTAETIKLKITLVKLITADDYVTGRMKKNQNLISLV
jgi:hypothetical protein